MGKYKIALSDKAKVHLSEWKKSGQKIVLKKIERIFNELSDNAEIVMPLGDTFWGAYFGMLTDKYGIQWMVSCG